VSKKRGRRLWPLLCTWVWLVGCSDGLESSGDPGVTSSAQDVATTATTLPSDMLPVTDGSALEGNSYVADGAMVAGVGKAFARPVTVTFENGRVGVDSGCNGYGGRYEVDAGRLAVTDAGSTLVQCEETLMEQEGTILRLFDSSPAISISTGGDRLLITSPDVTLHLTRR